MNPDFTNSTSQGNDDAAAGFGQADRISWLTLPNNMDASRRQLSSLSDAQVGASHLHVGAPRAPLDFRSAAAVSQTPSTAAIKHNTSSSIESSRASSREHIFVVGPAFSLADESSIKLQTVNAPQTTSNDSHQLAPVISNVQALSSNGSSTHSVSVLSPKVVSSQGPQICIGSVFSLAEMDMEHRGLPETENEASHLQIDSSAIRQTRQDGSALSHDNQQNKPNSAATAPVLSSLLFSSLNKPKVLRSSTHTMLDIINQRNSSVSVAPVPRKDVQLVPDCGTGVPASVATQQLTSLVTSSKDAQLSVNQKDGSVITVIENKPTDVLGDEKTQLKSILSKPQDSSSTSEVPLPFANVCKVQAPEVVDLDTEDIDDCLLVKIDLSRHHFSYGSKIHNSEVVIDDSDNDEDVTDLTKEARDVSSETTVSGESDNKNDACPISVNNEHCAPTGSLSMEVEEIHTEASSINSNSTGETCVISVDSRTSIQTLSEGGCSTWHSSVTQNPEPELMDLHVDDDDDDDSPTFEYVPIKVTPLQQDNSPSLAIQQDNMPNLTIQQDNMPTLAIQPVNMPTLAIQSMFSSSSLLGNTSDFPILKESYQTSCLEPTVQGQRTGNTPKSTEVLHSHHRLHEDFKRGQPAQVANSSKDIPAPKSTEVVHSLHHSHEDFMRGQPPQVANSSKAIPAVGFSRPMSYNIQLNSTTEEITNSESSQSAAHKRKALTSNRLKSKGKATKSKPPKIKTAALPESPILKESYHNSFSGPTYLGLYAGSANSFFALPVQGQLTGNANSFLGPTVQGRPPESTQKSTEAAHLGLVEKFMRDQTSLVAHSSKPVPAVGLSRPMSRNIQVNSTTEEITNSESSQSAAHKGKALTSTGLKRKGKATKSKPPKIKITALTKTQKKKQSSDSHVGSESSAATQGSQAVPDSSLMCKLCFMSFSCRMELVTHTWSWHRSAHTANNNPKCDKCGKNFPNNSVMKLHKKVNCACSIPSKPGTTVVSLDSIINDIMKQGVFTRAPQVSPAGATLWEDAEPQLSIAGNSSSSKEVTSTSWVPPHSKVSILLNSSSQGNEGNSNNSNNGAASNISPGAASHISTGVASHISPGVASQISTGVASQISTGVASQISTGVASHISTGVASHISTGVASNISPGMASQISTGVTSHISTGVASHISTGAASHISTGAVSNMSTGGAAQTKTNKCPGFAAGHSGEKPVNEEFMQEDIKPVITSTGEIQGQCPVTAFPSRSDCHKCTTCQKVCSGRIELSLHQISGRCKVAGNEGVKCFVCAKTFTSSIFKYLHVLNNPECKEKADRYCTKCLRLFESREEKQNHLRMFKECQVYEDYVIKDIMKDSLAKNVEHNVNQPEIQPCPTSTATETATSTGKTSEPDKMATPAQISDSMQVTDLPVADFVSCQRCKVLLPNKNTLQQHLQMNPACKNDSERLEGEGASKQKPPMAAKPNVTCPACKKKFATSAVLILHFNANPKCRMKICSSSKVAKKISASDKTNMQKPTDKISMPKPRDRINMPKPTDRINMAKPTDRINMAKPVTPPKSPRKTSKGNNIKSSSADVNTSRNVFDDISSTVKCKVCGVEFSSKKKLAQHHESQHICKKLQNDLPFFNLRLVLRRVSVMCKVCYLPFVDDIKLAEHLHLNQSCQIGTAKRAEKVLELKKSHLDNEAFKREGKKSCQIGTGISNVTSTISAVTKDGCITLAPANNINNENLSKVNDGQVSNDSSAMKMYVQSKGNSDDSDKGDLNSISSSDEGSGMDESASSSEGGNKDYTCKQCCKMYTSKSQLKKHNKLRHHSGHSKKAHCKVCTRKFHDVTGLQAHLLQFRFCFIPLTRPLWERKQDPHFCSMCRKVLSDAKDLRKHCFKKMACRLRYVNKVLQNIKEKEKDNASVMPATEAEVPASKAVTENYESHSANEVSSSVQDYCNPVEVDSSNSDVDVEDVTSCIKISHVVSKPLIECLNCSGLFDDFHEHLLKQQSCLDFFGLPGNICPVPLHFCYQCKTHFDDTLHVKLHACKGFVAYTHACQTCGLKFTSAQHLHAHVQQSLTCNKASSLPTQKDNDSDRIAIGSYAMIQQDGTLASSSGVKEVPLTLGEQSFPCLICDARFATLRLLMEHSYQHVEETPIACDRCNITFLHYNQFVSHQAFHMRMDKEANSLLGKQSPSKFGTASGTDKNIRNQRDDDAVKNYVSTCIFCHKEFANVKAKLAHLSGDYACLAVLKYVVESKLFSHDQKIRATDANCCEFCSLRFSDKVYHYLNSTCFGRLEAAILKYRSSSQPAERKEIGSAVNQSESEEANTRSIQSKHQEGQHSSAAASPSSGPTSSTGEFPEEACCLKCGRCFKTVAEIKEHQNLLGHSQILPHSVVKCADWQMHSWKCNICNVKYVQRRGLFLHMINKHCNKESYLFQVLGNTSKCSICHKKVMPAHMQLHFERHKKQFVQEIRGKSDQPMRTPSEELCIFCNRTYLSRKYVIIHLKRHEYADIFPPQRETSSGATNIKSPVSYKSKPVEDNQMTGPACKKAALSDVVGSCRLCQKQIKSHNKYFQNHFRMLHKDHVPERWREFFVPFVDLKEECPLTKPAAKGSKRGYVYMKKYRCRLCHTAFVQHRALLNHFSFSHADIAPERWEECTEKIEPTECKHTDNLHSAQSEPSKKENYNIKMQTGGYGSAILKSCKEPKCSNVGVKNKKNIKKIKALKWQQIVSCNICSRQFLKLLSFKIHFRHAHKRDIVKNWEDLYSVIESEYHNSKQTKTTKDFTTPQSVPEKLKLKRASIDSKSKSVDLDEFDTATQNVSFPLVSKKTEKLQPIGSCKLCHKKFTNFSVFKFHMKKSHALYTSSKDQKHLFKAFVPSHAGDNFENSGSEEDSSATISASSPEKKAISYPLKSKDLSSMNCLKILVRVCHVCQATFSDISSYQVHLRTHLKPCKIDIQDMHSQLMLNMPGVSKDHVDLQENIEDKDKEIVIIDDESEEECLYPDSTTSEGAKSVQTWVMKNSAVGSDFTNVERSKSVSSVSSISESHGDIVIDTSRSELSIGSHKNNCEVGSESGSVDMFSDDENEDLPNGATSISVGNIVHTIVDSLLNDCSPDHSFGKLQIEAATASDNRPTKSQLSQVPPNGANKVCNKRKADEADLEQDQCSEVKRRNLRQETVCNDQSTNDLSHVLGRNSDEKNGVDPDKILEPQRSETIQLGCSVGVEEEAISESSNISESAREVREVDEVDIDQEQNVEHQSWEMREVDNDEVQNVEDQSCEVREVDSDEVQSVEDQSCEVREVDEVDIDQEQNVEYQSYEMREVENYEVQNVEDQSCEREVDNDEVQNVKDQSCEREVDEVDNGEVQCVEDQSCEREVDNDEVQSVEDQSCEREVDNDEVQNVEHQSCEREVDTGEVQSVEDQSCEREVDNDEVQSVEDQSCEREVDNDEVQSVEDQSCEREVDNDEVQSVEDQSCEREVDNDEVQSVEDQSCEREVDNDEVQSVEVQSCEREVDNDEVQSVEDQSCEREVDNGEVQSVEDQSCEREVDEVDNDEVQSVEDQSCEVREVDNDEVQSVEDQSCEREVDNGEVQSVEDQSCEREVDEVDNDEVQSVEDQSCEVREVDEVDNDEVQSVEDQSCEREVDNGEVQSVEDQSCEREVDNGEVQSVEDQSCEREVDEVDNDEVQSVEDQSCEVREVDEVDIDQEQNVEHQSYEMREVENDEVQNVEDKSCEREVDEVDNGEVQCVEDQSCEREVDNGEVQNVEDRRCEVREVDEVDNDGVQSVEDQSCEVREVNIDQEENVDNRVVT